MFTELDMTNWIFREVNGFGKYLRELCYYGSCFVQVPTEQNYTAMPLYQPTRYHSHAEHNPV
jgi:hypothetical protein